MTPYSTEAKSLRIGYTPILGEDGTIYIVACDPGFYTTGKIYLMWATIFAISPDGTLQWKFGAESLKDTRSIDTLRPLMLSEDGAIYAVVMVENVFTFGKEVWNGNHPYILLLVEMARVYTNI